MEYPDDCITTIKHVVSKVATMEGGLYSDLAVDKECTTGIYCSGQVDLAYDTSSLSSPSTFQLMLVKWIVLSIYPQLDVDVL